MNSANLHLSTANAAHLREVEEREVSALASHAVTKYRIENHQTPATLYWNTDGMWRVQKENATPYTEAERYESLDLHVAGKPNGFPEHGLWVPFATIECHECGTEEKDISPRLAAEKIYQEGYMIYHGNVLCKECQAL